MKRLLQVLILLLFIASFIIPGYTFFFVSNTQQVLFGEGIDTATKLYTVFRLFGLYAFTMVWNQVMLGTFRLPLTKLFGTNILKLHMTTGLFTLLFATLHPLFFYTAQMLSGQPLNLLDPFTDYLGPLAIYGWLGEAAFFIMILTVTTAKLRTKSFLQKHWRKIHFLNYIIFILVFLHSFNIGAEVSLQPLQTLYLFFGITFLAGITFRRLLPMVTKLLKRPDPQSATTKL